MTQMMRFSCIWLLCVCTFNSFSQTDSTDLDFSVSDPILITEEDSLMYPTELFGSLSLEFNISDTSNFEKVHVELSVVDNNNLIISHQTFSISELQILGLIEDWAITIDFGNHELGHLYCSSIVIENINGILGKEIHKTLNP